MRIDVSWPKPESLTDFLLARISEDEAAALAALPWDHDKVESWIDAELPTRQQEAHLLRYSPARVLAECEAKRRLVDFLTRQSGLIYESEDDLANYLDPDTGLELLSLPYADHPDYREVWRP